VTVELDGKPISSLKTDYSGFTPQPFWALRDSHCLGVGSASIQAVFHAIKVKEVGGAGKVKKDGD